MQTYLYFLYFQKCEVGISSLARVKWIGSSFLSYQPLPVLQDFFSIKILPSLSKFNLSNFLPSNIGLCNEDNKGTLVQKKALLFSGHTNKLICPPKMKVIQAVEMKRPTWAMSETLSALKTSKRAK